jgi:hypothetical protein
MAHAQKSDFVFRRNGWVHLNRREGRGESVQSTTGSRGVLINGSNAGYTMFRGSVKSTGYPLHSPVSPSLPLPASPCAITYPLDSTSWEANRFSVSQDIPPHFMETEVSLPHSQVPANCHYPEPARSSPYLHIPFFEDIYWDNVNPNQSTV